MRCVAIFLPVFGLLACSTDEVALPAPQLDAEPDGAETADAGASEAGDAVADDGPTTLPCAEDNSDAATAKRDGFVEVCADPASDPRAVCGDGSPYKLSYRRATGASKGLLLFFKGGGNCNDYVSCWGKDGKGGTGRRVSTMDNAKWSAPAVIPGVARTVGWFDRVDTQNPFLGWDVVWVSYCTGDGGLEDTEKVLTRPADADPSAPSAITTYFHGSVNAKFAVAFAGKTFPSPARVAIVGSSAGAYASMNAVPTVAATYPKTVPIAYVSEGGAAVGRDALSTATLDTLKAFDGSAGRRIRFGQMTFASDATQRDYSPAPFGEPARFAAELKRLFAERAAAAPNHYRYFSKTGTCHTVGQSVALFQQFTKDASGKWSPVTPAVKPNPDLTVAGTSFPAWVSAIVYGDGPIGAEVGNLDEGFAIGTTCPLPGGD